MRRRPPFLLAALLALFVLSSVFTGCATAFSPAVIRGEIARQTGQDPRSVFELSLGRPTMALAKAVLATYEVPGGGGELDFTRMPLRGWEPVVKFREGPKSAFVLVRPAGDAIGDLVVVAWGGKRVVYARIQGRLSPALPEALGRTVRGEGPEAIQRELMSLSGQQR